METAPRRRRVLSLPAFAAAALLCLLARPFPVSVLAPACGPWTGVHYGHLDSTLGGGAPLSAFGLVAIRVAALAALRFVRPEGWRTLALVLTAL